MIPSLPASVIVASLMLSCSVCLPKLHLSWRLLKARTEVNLFNYSLAICLAVAGETWKKVVKSVGRHCLDLVSGMVLEEYKLRRK